MSQKKDYPAILLVEDNRINQKFIALMLKNLGYDCDRAPHGQEALELVSEKPYDLILLDCRMPVMNGFETAKRIRKMDQRAPALIIGMTADPSEETRLRCRLAGMDHCLAKPLTQEELERVIAMAGQDVHPVPPTPSMASQSPKTLDIDRIHQVSFKQPAIERPLITTILKTIRQHLETIAKAVASRDRLLAKNTAHTLKGASAAFGAERLSHAASQLEKCCDQPLDATADALVAELHQEDGRLGQALQAYLEALPTNGEDD